MTRFRPTRIGKMPLLLWFSVAGLLLPQFVFAAAPNASPAAAAIGATRKIVGYAVDPTGWPIADALVLFTRADDRSVSPPQPTVIAQSHTQSTGRFELSVSAANLKTPAVGWPVFAIWVHKTGFALAHSTLSPEQCERPYLVAMEVDSPVSIRVEMPDGLPCSTARVTPIMAESLKDWHNRLPQAMQDRLKTQTTANGRCEVPGFNNRRFAAAIETPEFGTQTLIVAGRHTPFATVRLRRTHAVAGRLLLPSGAKADLSRTTIAMTMEDNRRRALSAALGKDLSWYDSLTVQLDADGCYEVAHVPEGLEIVDFCPTRDLPFVAGTRLDFQGLGIHSSETRQGSHGRKRHIRFSISWGSSLPEVLLRLVHSIYSPQTVWEQYVWLRRGVRVTRIVRDAETKRPLPGVCLRMASVPRNREFQSSFAKVRTLVPIVGLPFTGVVASGDFALARWIAVMNPSSEDSDNLYSDEQGHIECCLCPGQLYATVCGAPEHYFPLRPDRLIDEVPAGVAQCELPPIELVPQCRLTGHCEDAAGRPAAGLRIRATVAASGHQSELGPRWTKSDAWGGFHFDGLEPGTSLTLVAVHAGVPLEERTVVVGDPALAGGVQASQSGPWKLMHVLREKHQELTSLSGRVVGPDHKPIPGAQVVVEVEHSPDPTHFFRATVDAAGRVRTPPQYPRGLKYRLAVRSMLKSVAVSPWICPQTRGTQFADVVVDPARLGLDKRMSGGEVVALVDGWPILASELFERAFTEQLTPDGLSLLVAGRGTESGRVTEREYRELQLLAIKKYVGDYARTRMLARALEAGLDQEQKVDVDRRLDAEFEKYIEKLERDLKVVSRDQVDEKLHSQGTSLASLKKEFCNRLLADEYVRRAGTAAESRLDGRRLLAYYESHLALYALPAKVSWQMLEFEFGSPPNHASAKEQVSQAQVDDYLARSGDGASKSTDAADSSGRNPFAAEVSQLSDQHSLGANESCKKKEAAVDIASFAELAPNPPFNRAAARVKSEAALAELRKGTSFEQVVKTFAVAAQAEGGGWQPRLRPESVADPKTAAALRQLPEGSTGGVIETESAYRIVKVVCRMPAAWQSFEDVAPMIRWRILEEAKQTAIEELYRRTTIESPYAGELADQRPAAAPPKSDPADAFSE